MPLHLLFPLASSFGFVLAMLYTKQATGRGASPWTGTFFANLWLAIGWAFVFAGQDERLPMEGWWQAGLIGAAFVVGQLLTYLAFSLGDVSVAAPVLGVKVIIVALVLALIIGEPVTGQVWLGAFLAAAGVAVIQFGASSAARNRLTATRAVLTVVLALLSATSFSLFDVGLQTWGRAWGADRFLPPMFVSTGLLSLAFLPRVDSLSRLRQLGVLRPLLLGTIVMALQSMSMAYALNHYGDATRINIVYALRGLWAVLFAWWLARQFGGAEAQLAPRIMLIRLAGAILLMLSILVALWPD